MKIRISFLLWVFAAIGLSNGFAQCQPPLVYTNMFHDSIGVAITPKAFNNLCLKLNQKIKSNHKLQAKDLVSLIKIHNTIDFYGFSYPLLVEDQYIFKYYQTNRNYIYKKMDFILTRGLGWYSKKYDLYKGGTMSDPYSIYFITGQANPR